MVSLRIRNKSKSKTTAVAVHYNTTKPRAPNLRKWGEGGHRIFMYKFKV